LEFVFNELGKDCLDYLNYNKPIEWNFMNRQSKVSDSIASNMKFGT